MRGFLGDLRSAARGVAALAGCACACAAGSFLLHRDAPAVRLACADVARVREDALMGGGPGEVLWVDARWESEYEDGHLAGSVCFNEVNWEAQVSSLAFSWRPGMRVVVYADPGDGWVARRVAALARVAVGLGDVAYLDGDWRELRAAFGSAEGER